MRIVALAEVIFSRLPEPCGFQQAIKSNEMTGMFLNRPVIGSIEHGGTTGILQMHGMWCCRMDFWGGERRARGGESLRFGGHL